MDHYNILYLNCFRIIIRVPQRTKHIYHQQVKKVPVYILLPDKKPKVLDDLEEFTKSSVVPCKESHKISWREDRPYNYRYVRSERDRGELEREHEETYRSSRLGSREKTYQSSWTEDRENRGAYVPTDQYRTIEDDFPPPPPSDIADLPFQRVYTEDSSSTYIDSSQEQRNHPSPVTYTEHTSGHRVVSFTYAPETMENSYQYRIMKRVDNTTMGR